jgi:mevalonate kinase
MSTVTEILGNVDAEIEEVLDQKHKCEGLYAEIMINKKKLESLAEVYNKELAKYKKMLAK